MQQEIAPAHKHPAALAAILIAGVAVTALALVTIAYLIGWVPTRGGMPAGPGSIAVPGQQLSGSVQGGVDLLPGETLVAPAEPALAAAAPAAPSAPSTPPAMAPRPVTPQYAKPAPLEPPRPAAVQKTPPPIYTQPAPPTSSTSYATVLPSRAAPSKPNYNREAPVTSFERSTRNVCVNCGAIASIGSAGGEWEVRVRFDDGGTETLRYPERPRLRIGERVHLEDGRLVPE